MTYFFLFRNPTKPHKPHKTPQTPRYFYDNLYLKKSEKDLKEIYLLAGTAHNEEKLFSYNDFLLLTHKNSYSNGIGGDTTITNNNNNLIENNNNEIFEKKPKKKI